MILSKVRFIRLLLTGGAVLITHLATTGNGSLLLRIDKVDDPLDNHNLTYRSGMVCSRLHDIVKPDLIYA